MSNQPSWGDRTERWSPTVALIGGAFFVVALLAWLVGGSPEGHRYMTLVTVAIVAGAVCLLAAVVMRPRLWMRALGMRQVSYGLVALVSIVAFLFIVVMINIAAKQPSLSREWDLTEEQELTLTQGTVDVLAALKEPVQVLGLYVSDQQGTQEQVESLLKRYQAAAPGKITYQFLDPIGSVNGLVAAQSFLQKNQILAADLGLYVMQGDRRQKVTASDEKSITLAIYRLTTTQQVVYLLQGHGELTDTSLSTAKSSLEQLGYSVRTTSITGTLVPTDTSVLVAVQPLANFKQNEVDAIRTYVEGGGSFILFIDPDPFMAEPFGGPLDQYLRASWGITVTADAVIDRETMAATNLGVLATAVMDYPAHLVTQNLRLPTVLENVRSVQIAATPPEGVSVSPILVSPEPSVAGSIYGETDLQNASTYDPAADQTPPLNYAVAATRKVADTGRFGRVIVAGSSSLISESVQPQGISFIGEAQLGNKDLWNNMITWLLTDVQNAGTPPNVDRTTTARTLDPTKATSASVQWVGISSVCLVPGLVVIAGLVVFFSRRRQK